MRTAVSLALIFVSAGLAANEAPAPPQATFHAASRTVAVYVTVSDTTGKLVPDLMQEDFEIYDNGKKQAITLFDSGVQPITVVMMLDRSGSMTPNFRLVRNAAEQFVGLLQPGDKARIGSFANRIQVDPRAFTNSQRDLIEILRTELQEPGPTPLWNAVNVGITSLLHQDGRRVVLVFTDGIDHPIGSNNISFHDVARNAEEEDVMVFAIGLVHACIWYGDILKDYALLGLLLLLTARWSVPKLVRATVIVLPATNPRSSKLDAPAGRVMVRAAALNVAPPLL